MLDAPIFPPKDYGREDIKQIMSSVRKGNSAIIIGLPGIGKSTIARLLANSHQQVWRDHLSATDKIYYFVHIDYSFKPDFQEVMRQVRWELTRQGCSIPHDGDGFETLDAWLATEDCSKCHFVLVFDGYDEVEDSQARTLLNRLRRLRNRQMNMSFLFVGRREPRTLYEIDELIDAVYYISPLNERDQHATIQRHERRLNCIFDEGQKQWLLSYCGGWPGFMKYMCDLLYDGKIIAADQIIPTCLADRRIRQICQDIWSDLAQDERTRLIEVATGRKVQDDDLTRRLKTKHLLDRRSHLRAEILKKYILSLPEPQRGFCTWQIKLSLLTVTVEGEEYYFKLTPKETGLLTLLMEKSPGIVSLDEIQQAVWPYNPDDSNQVPDTQSITKLVSRVHLKIDGALPMNKFLSPEESSVENTRNQGYYLNRRIRVKND